MNGSDDKYTVNIERATVTELSVGDNYVAATYEGNSVTFTAEESGTYVLSWTSSNAYVMVESANGSETISSGYLFTLTAGDSVTFAFSVNGSDDKYTVNIQKQ